ncbi:SMC-Scp complex subunit ScpB [Geobacter anodireducens]|uniref:SMC-Scp complex subunit ScpB n=1 Tax=Geobacter anodireducens TaxID=1340425 RepID=A0ABR9NWR3_9BACT|nr:SMC-Scp complex subunit ScpB [Geobacter anodireducens]ANA40217.1 SMC-Scp complex subunit ScpB [Geobacter anodireducens]MBE2888693.1 SMC-Scp complex subunit ScpB [Geobacter anodireducens]HMN03435.1 SMC-Scp complex subunit ScpB [Geobacter anodireducens]
MHRLESLVESLLFVSETPLSLDRLCSLLEEFDRAAIREALDRLLERYGGEGRGIVLAEVGGGFQFRTPAGNGDVIRRLTKARPARFSQSALETLAIIAYRQPVTRAEIEYLRGVDSGGVLKTLLEKKLIKILGKRDIPGKPLIYGTTREFLELFALRDLKSLPSLKEIRELSESAAFEQQEELPLAAPPEEGRE